MGKTFSTGLLTDGIAQDSSNNIGIGGAASGSYKLQVTGATNLNGALSGTSATFSGAINLTGTANTFQVASIFRNANRVFFGGDTGGYFFQNSANSATLLQIADSGAATFSSSVFSTTFFVPANEGIAFNGVGSFKTAIYSRNSGGDLCFNAGDSEKMRITSNGNVGIGTSSPRFVATNRTTLDINGTSTSLLALSVGGADKSYLFQNGDNFALNNVVGNIAITTEAASIITLATSNTERLRITSGGLFYYGVTSSTNTALFTAKASASSTNWSFGPNAANSTNIFRVENADTTGVYLTTGNTSWTANSDERLKNIDSEISKAIDSIMTLRAVKYSWKKDSTNKLNIGLIAQDVQKVFPEVIDIQEDEMNTLGVRYQELVPVLVKAIQEQQAQIEAQAIKIEELKALIAAK